MIKGFFPVKERNVDKTSCVHSQVCTKEISDKRMVFPSSEGQLPNLKTLKNTSEVGVEIFIS